MSREEFNKLPKPKLKSQQYITDSENQTFKIDFVEYDFEREEYYYLPKKGSFAGKIYESDAELTDPPKSSAMETYELIFGKK